MNILNEPGWVSLVSQISGARLFRGWGLPLKAFALKSEADVGRIKPCITVWLAVNNFKLPSAGKSC